MVLKRRDDYIETITVASLMGSFTIEESFKTAGSEIVTVIV